MENKPIETWDDYKDHVRKTDPEAARTLDVGVGLADVICAMIIRRQELGMTIEQLAEKSGVSVSTIKRIENGSVSPNVETLIHVLKALGLMLTVKPWEE